MSDDDLDELEQVACPSAGACGAQFTANTMATVSEAFSSALRVTMSRGRMFLATSSITISPAVAQNRSRIS
jgi:dihydroxyacid dehydratase/phosphogluconate dehydratase